MKIKPDYTKLHIWEQYPERLLAEYGQAMEEGKDLAVYESLFRTVSSMPLNEYKVKIADVLYDLSLNAGIREDFPYEEPSDLEGIKAAAQGDNKVCVSTDVEEERACGSIWEEQLRKKLHGAWMGRICGCLLGKPIEGIHTEELHPLLKQSKNFPMTRYILSSDVTKRMREEYSFFLGPKLSVSSCFADEVSFMPYDDDTNYVVLALKIIEKYGKDFTPFDVAQSWMELQPKTAYCTAERVAYCNFVNGIFPPESAVYHNPYRQGIGAQIRGDYYGYISPGNPTQAAEMAFKDASISHVKNGIYGEMYIASMLAIAAVEEDMISIVTGAMKQIPAKSRLYESLNEVLDWYKKGVTCEECFDRIHVRWDEHVKGNWGHVIPNAMIVTAALLYGGGDFGKSICLAVQTAFDTDCNGATVGSVAGMRCGIDGIEEKWQEPINGTLETTICGMDKVKIEDMVEITMKHIRGQL